jgi:hypothetical protein
MREITFWLEEQREEIPSEIWALKEGYFKIDLTQTGYEVVNWSELTQEVPVNSHELPGSIKGNIFDQISDCQSLKVFEPQT